MENIKITTDQVQSTQTTSSAPTLKTMQELSSGDRFKATVTDIRYNQVTLKLENGDSLTAKAKVLPEARIGDESIFLVKENAKGQILLEMLKPENSALLSNLVKESLAAAGLYHTTENADLVKSLMQNGLPIDPGTLQKAAFFKYSAEDMTLDKILLLLTEELPTTEKSVTILNDIMNKSLRLQPYLQELTSQLLSIDDANLKNELLRAILKSGSNPLSDSELQSLLENAFGKAATKDGLAELAHAVEKRLFLQIDNQNPEDKALNRYFNDLNDIAKLIMEKTAGQGKYESLQWTLERVTDTFKFMEHINTFKEYMMFPFMVHDKQHQGELFVFKDKKGSKNYHEQASILLALDYAYLGHVEVFVNKVQTSVSLQFRLENQDIIRLVNQNSAELTELLQSSGFTVTSIQLKKLEEAFQITDTPQDKTPEEKSKRYSFDMRV